MVGRLYKIAQVREITQLSRSKIYELIAAGRLEACKLDGCTVVTEASIEALIKTGIDEAKRVWRA